MLWKIVIILCMGSSDSNWWEKFCSEESEPEFDEETPEETWVRRFNEKQDELDEELYGYRSGPNNIVKKTVPMKETKSSCQVSDLKVLVTNQRFILDKEREKKESYLHYYTEEIYENIYKIVSNNSFRHKMF